MLSFVVQNFNSTPFLIKTLRYAKFVTSQNTLLLHLFIKNVMLARRLLSNAAVTSGAFLPLAHLLFNKPFWRMFKKIYTQSFGIFTTNLTKSYQYKTFWNLNHFLTYQNKPLSPSKQILTLHTVRYVKPVRIVSFAFQNDTYNSFMIYIFFLLVDMRPSAYNDFRLYYSFILYPPNFALYDFGNLFYFKLRHY